MLTATIILAAGGTGGHIFPAESVACALVDKGYKVVFITDKAGRRFDKLPANVQVMALPMYRRNNSLKGLVKFGWGLIKSMYHAYRGLKILKPSVVVGFGGYPSFPVVSVAQGINIPTIIHEQNSVLGQVNRLLSGRAKKVALTFSETERVRDGVASVITGTPVRSAFHVYRATDYKAFKEDEPIRILVTGGSQGANIFSNIVPDTIAKLPSTMQQRGVIIHQCPKNGVEALKQKYEALGIQATVTDFIDNMAAEMSAAHLVIARAGASTLAELAMIGRPAILVPFPSAKDNHQWVNAQSVERANAGWCVDQKQFTSDYLARKLEELFNAPEYLYDAAMRMKALAKPDATEHIVNLIEAQITKG